MPTAFSGLRALLIPSDKRRQLAARRRRVALFGLEDAGRWSLIRKRQAATNDGEALEQVADILLRRYGVVFRRVLEREADWLPPWHALLRVYPPARGAGKDSRRTLRRGHERRAVRAARRGCLDARDAPPGGAAATSFR